MTTSLNRIVTEVCTQGLISIPTGAIIDNLMPSSKGTVTDSNVLQTLVEIIAQFALNGLCVTSFTDFMGRYTNVNDGRDPTKAIVMIMGLVGTQPHLISKIQSISTYLGVKTQGIYFAASGQTAIAGVHKPSIPTSDKSSNWGTDVPDLSSL